MNRYHLQGREGHIENRMDYDNFGELMEVYSHCNRFERRHDFDAFSMGDYQSCENCRHLGPGDRCLVK